ncbi:hypothetical protein ALC56_14068 [Trachymyrmex septentrionalis]|uniref:Uncharacterized protein n=1 Tax=Trachymyrmex septentrionalis TaxID=34720 RepID=A0A195ETI9_9HYME|nr:hypothetical protein ALC56_14068 [Trachymyrmex septentrionalis]
MIKSKSTKPPRSPDLNPLDYFLWGHQKSLVYTTPIENENDLRNQIVASCEAIRNTSNILERVHQSLRKRLDGCITHTHPRARAQHTHTHTHTHAHTPP